MLARLSASPPWLCVVLSAASLAAQGDNGAPARAVDPYTVVGPRHYLNDYSPIVEGGAVQVVIEIPAGTNAKWEVDKDEGTLRWEMVDGAPRVVRYLPYPGSYGMVPRTLLPADRGGDGDPLDVLVLGPALPRGSVARVRLIGVLRLLDDGEQDDKLLAVAVDQEGSSGVPAGGAAGLGEVRDLGSLPPGATAILELWFTNYKGPGRIESKGFGDAAEARRILDAAVMAFEGR